MMTPAKNLKDTAAVDSRGVREKGPASSGGGGRPRPVRGFLAGGIVLVGLHLALLALSPRLGYGAAPGSWPVLALVGLEVAAGAVYFWSCGGGREAGFHFKLLAWIFLVGIILRAVMFCSTPILEDDFHRYLWDGAVTARGFNPYQYSPQAILAGFDSAGPVPEALVQLARESGEIIHRINHPQLRTVYPPVSQAAFALAYWLRPFSLNAWRLVLLGFDLATLVLLLAVLKSLKLPLFWVAVYWWNPLLVKEVINSGHMDLVALPLVLAAVLLSLRARHLAALACLAGAVAAKIWPLVLLPLVLRPLLAKPRRLVSGFCFFVLLAGLLFLPVFLAGPGVHSGFWAYGQRWEMNDALFKLIQGGSWLFLRIAGLQDYAPAAARFLAGGLLILWLAWLVRFPAKDGQDFCRRGLLAVAAVFFLSPTQFPWYYVWLLPLLALGPRSSLLLLTVLLPLYYLRYFFLSRGEAAVFDYGIVWLEYLPVWLLLAWEWRTGAPFLINKEAGHEG